MPHVPVVTFKILSVPPSLPPVGRVPTYLISARHSRDKRWALVSHFKDWPTDVKKCELSSVLATKAEEKDDHIKGFFSKKVLWRRETETGESK